MSSHFFLVAGAGFAHMLQARNFIFENKFSREDFLAIRRLADLTCDL